MIYTIGYKESYDAGLLEYGDTFLKTGPGIVDGKAYNGGAAFKTFLSAQRFIDGSVTLEHYDVYGLVGDWDADTIQYSGEPFRRIMRAMYIRSAEEEREELLAEKEANTPHYSLPIEVQRRQDQERRSRLWQRINDVVTTLETVTTLPTPGDLYYPVKDLNNEPGWNYHVTGLTVSDLREAADALKERL